MPQSTNAAEKRQQKPPPNLAAGAALGVGAGTVRPVPNNPPQSGAAIGIGGGVAQGAAPPPPSGGGGGGGGGGSAPSPFMQMSAATGMTANDWAALLAAQSAPAPQQQAAPNYDMNPEGGIAGGTLVPQLGEMPPGEGSSIYSDPGFLAFVAGLDSELANSESGYRREQDETRRRFTDALPQFERTWDQNRDRIRNSFEARGLLKSGGTDDAVSRSFQSQGDERSRMESNTADAVANLEQQIAMARSRNAQQRGQAALQYAGQQPVT